MFPAIWSIDVLLPVSSVAYHVVAGKGMISSLVSHIRTAVMFMKSLSSRQKLLPTS